MAGSTSLPARGPETMAVLDATPDKLDMLIAAQGHHGGPDWLEALRARGRDGFRALGLPTPRAEDWRNLRLNALYGQSFTAGEGAVPMLTWAHLMPIVPKGIDCDRITMVNGRFSADLSAVGDLPEGVQVSGLADAIASDAARIEPVLGRIARGDADGFAALNQAALADGAAVIVPRGVDLSRPVHLLHHALSPRTPVVAQPRIVIDLAENARATVIEHWRGLAGETAFVNAVVEIRLARGARLNLIRLQTSGEAAFHIDRLAASVADDATLNVIQIDLGARLSRHGIDVMLDGRGATATLDGLFAIGAEQQTDTRSNVEHRHRDGRLSQTWKGVAGGRARGIFCGRVHVLPGAVGSDASMSSRNLLASRTAEILPKPELEIHADEVKCAHGATVGAISEQELFYLQSRGLDAAEGRRILTRAFAEEIVDRLPFEDFRAQVSGWVDRHMAQTVLTDAVVKEATAS
ncbi:Fe-S cluster assembly protein SufD [Tistrella sp. BH-R2-4]|uniref:Fe-S cluster assembly protein SufD n=1 Tax=Tistrella arctica TaxID=3133430 RepID=A0ABU9YFY7_9PROT